MTTAQITAPAIEPVSLAEAKQHLRVDDTDSDALIGELITAARQYLEQASDTRLISQTWRQFEDAWPVSNCLNLKIHPVQSVLSVTAYDNEGVARPVDSSEYEVDLVSRPARILAAGGIAASRAMNGIEVDIVAGYGDTPLDVPDTLKRAILMLVAHWYEFRGAVAPHDQPVSLPPGFDTLIGPFKRVAL